MTHTSRLGWKAAATLLLVAAALTGCENDLPQLGRGESTTDAAVTVDEAVQAPRDPLLDLANRLRAQRETLETQRAQREQLVVKRRGELARLTAELQRQIRRTGQTVETVLAQFAKAAPTQEPLAAIHADYVRAGQLENHIARLTKALEADAGLTRKLLRTEEKLRQDAEANAALDPSQREAAENLLAEAAKHDPFAAAPDGSLKPESVELQASMEAVAGALRIRVAAMPTRTETSIEDVPALPELKFQTSGGVEATFLTAAQNDLAAGREAAAKLFTEKQPEAAIERLYEALDAVRQRLASFKTPPAWSSDCVRQLDEAAAALSEQLAAPYVAALTSAGKDAYLAADEASRTTHWAHVLDLLEALVQLAPQAKEVPDAFFEIDQYLYSQERLKSLEAAVARERFETLRQMLTPGAPRRDAPPTTVTQTRVPIGVGGQLHGVSLATRHSAQQALGEAGYHYVALDAQVGQLLLRHKPNSDAVKNAERERAAALNDVRRALAARDQEDSHVFWALDKKLAERRAARDHLISAIRLREDASEVRQVDAQIVAIQQSQTAFQAGLDHARGGPTIDVLQFVADPLNLLFERTITLNGVQFVFISIPAGAFHMGDDAANRVAVTLTGSRLMLQTEVTQAMFSAIETKRPWQGKNCVKEDANSPAVYVSATDADAWCKAATAEARRLGQIKAKESLRLPTAAEWEYAARAGTTTAYFFGEDASQLGDYAWYEDNAWDIGEQYAHPVGLKKPNPWGLLDMCGNVWELCADGYQSKLLGGTNPLVSPTDKPLRVCRGGSYFNGASRCRVGHHDYDGTNDNIGFRVLLWAGE